MQKKGVRWKDGRPVKVIRKGWLILPIKDRWIPWASVAPMWLSTFLFTSHCIPFIGLLQIIRVRKWAEENTCESTWLILPWEDLLWFSFLHSCFLYHFQGNAEGTNELSLHSGHQSIMKLDGWILPSLVVAWFLLWFCYSIGCYLCTWVLPVPIPSGNNITDGLWLRTSCTDSCIGCHETRKKEIGL